MKYLILGGNGFIGSAVRENLLTAGHSVLTFGIEPDPKCPERNGSLAHLQGDFSTYSLWRPILAEYKTVFHCISTTTPHTADLDPSFDLQSNSGALLRFLPFAADANAKVVFVSSAGTVYGATAERFISESHPTDPICAYGVGKLAMEKYLHFYHHRYGLSFAVARVSNPFGERQNLLRPQGAVGVFLRKAMLGEIIEVWGDGHVVRDFIYIEDVAEALVRISQYSGPSPIFNIGMGKGRSLNQIITAIEDVLGHPVIKIYKPGRPEDVPYNVLSTEKAKRQLGWRPVTSSKKAWQGRLRGYAIRPSGIPNMQISGRNGCADHRASNGFEASFSRCALSTCQYLEVGKGRPPRSQKRKGSSVVRSVRHLDRSALSQPPPTAGTIDINIPLTPKNESGQRILRKRHNAKRPATRQTKPPRLTRHVGNLRRCQYNVRRDPRLQQHTMVGPVGVRGSAFRWLSLRKSFRVSCRPQTCPVARPLVSRSCVV